MKKTIVFTIIIQMSIICIGCDSPNTYRFIIDNKTAGQIDVVFKDRQTLPDSSKSAQIKSGELKLISTYDITSGNADGASDIYRDTVYQFSYMTIKGYDTLKTQKSFLNRGEWSFSANKDIGEYILTIDSTDF